VCAGQGAKIHGIPRVTAFSRERISGRKFQTFSRNPLSGFEAKSFEKSATSVLQIVIKLVISISGILYRTYKVCSAPLKGAKQRRRIFARDGSGVRVLSCHGEGYGHHNYTISATRRSKSATSSSARRVSQSSTSFESAEMCVSAATYLSSREVDNAAPDVSRHRSSASG